jgi:mRNA interferase MazF
VNRGEIWWLRGKVRCPALIVQADEFNESRIQTVICALINSDLRFALAPGNVLITAEQSGLPRDAAINVAQIVTMSRSSLVERAGALSDASVLRVDAGLRISLGV